MKMRINETWKVVGVVAVASACLTPRLSAQQTVPAAHTALLAQFAALHSLSLQADVTLTLHQEIPDSGIPVGVPITGVFEYSANGDRWRRRSSLDETLFPGMNTVAAYDGTAYSYEMLDQGVVSVSFSGANRTTGMTLPNPILELGRFCSPVVGESMELRLASVRSGANNPTAPINVEQTNDGSTRVTCTGGDIGNLETTFTLTYDSNDLLRRIEQTLINSDIPLAVIVCDNYQPCATESGFVMLWPRSVTFLGTDPATGQPGATIEMSLNQISIEENTADESIYSPNWNGFSHVWLDDPEVFIP